MQNFRILIRQTQQKILPCILASNVGNEAETDSMCIRNYFTNLLSLFTSIEKQNYLMTNNN